MKTLIINPPSEHGVDRNGRWPAKVKGGTIVEPLFLAYAAAVLEKNNLAVELIDCPALQMARKELLEKIAIDKSIGLIAMQIAVPCFLQDIEMAKTIKEMFPEIKIVLIGPHATAIDKEILEKYRFIDFVARGEYDYTILDLAKGLKPEKVLGLSFIKGKELVRTANRPVIENLDELPFPARHFLPMEKYFEPVFKSKNTFRIFGSRGCPFSCVFCLWPQTMFGRRARFRSPEKIVDEIEYLINNYQAKGIYFEDDTFTVRPGHVFKICDELLKRKIKISWSCLGRVDCVSEEMLKKMKIAGCCAIRYGVESSSQELLDKAKKKINIFQIKKAFEITKKAGIETYADYAFGLIGETKETMENTIKFAIDLSSDFAQFSVLVPYPGTEIYEEAKKNNWLKKEENGNYVLNYPGLSSEEIACYSKKAYRQFYFRPGYILKRGFKIKSFSEIPQLAKGAFNVFKNSYFKE